MARLLEETTALLPGQNGGNFVVRCENILKLQDASTLKTVAEWLRSRWTPVGAQFNITAADLDRLAEGLPPQGMSE